MGNTSPNTSPNGDGDEPDAVCGTATINVSAGAGEFFKTLGSYLGTMFKCLYLAYKGWAHDGWKISALKKNRRWLYILLSILFFILIIVIIAALATAASSSTKKLKEQIAEGQHAKEVQAQAMERHVQAELAAQRQPPPAYSAVPPPTYRQFSMDASSSYAPPPPPSSPWGTASSF